MKEIAGRFFPKQLLEESNISQKWCGLRPCTPDDKPVIGEFRGGGGGVWMNTGHGGRGITQGLATSWILSNLLEGKYDRQWLDKYVEPFLASRF